MIRWYNLMQAPLKSKNRRWSSAALLGLTFRKSIVSGRPVTTQSSAEWHFYHINFPESLTMGLAPMLGEIPGSGQPNRHAPGLPTRSRNGAAVTLFHQGRPTAGRSRFPSTSGPVAPPAATMPRASPRPLPADSSSSGRSALRSLLLPRAPPSRGAGQTSAGAGKPCR